MSLAQLSAWCAERFGEHTVDSESSERPFDIPWLVLDSRRAASAWQWAPQTKLDDILNEIAAHADQNPAWLELTDG